MNRLFVFLAAVFVLMPFYCSAQAASRGSMIINEIAWMGTTNSATDEWMELKNTTGSAIDLSGWTLKSVDDPSTGSRQGKLKINLKGAVGANGFYLLERTNDNSVPNILADIIYSGSLSNAGEYLKLYNSADNVIDQANFSAKWPAGNNTAKQTMERTNSLDWQTSKDPNGTPKSQNSLGLIENSPSQGRVVPEMKFNAGLTEAQIVKTYPKGVIINEILPTPEGPDEINEWIELYNSSSFDVDLSGWKVQDTGGVKTNYTFPKDIKILNNGYLVLRRPETKIVLNNDEDGLNLILPNGEIIDSIFYKNAPQKQSYSKIGSDWQWSITPTPKTANIITTNISREKTKTLSRAKKSDNKANLTPAAASESINQFLNNSDQGEKNRSNPLFLFLTALALIIISAIIILILKFKTFKRTDNKN